MSCFRFRSVGTRQEDMLHRGEHWSASLVVQPTIRPRAVRAVNIMIEELTLVT